MPAPASLAKRETFFRCTYSAGPGEAERVAHVVAWDAGEAVELFAAELREEGVLQRGTIEVVPMRGAAAVRRAPYRPRLVP